MMEEEERRGGEERGREGRGGEAGWMRWEKRVRGGMRCHGVAGKGMA